MTQKNDQVHSAKDLSGRSARDRLIYAGLLLFAKHGLDGVKTRMLADKAEVNQSAIPYYFGGKDGVYAAVILDIADSLREALAMPPAADAVTHPRNKVPDDYASELRNVMRGFTLTILSPPAPLERAMLIVREQLSPTAYFEILFERFIAPLHQKLCFLVAGLQNSDRHNRQVVIRAHALVGQALAFVVANEAFLRRTNIERIDAKIATEIADVVSQMSVDGAISQST
jgi:TetR/AcrR family transcriptional regulator, regulator of cefoperazone and chloramphenicol sensitivity